MKLKLMFAAVAVVASVLGPATANADVIYDNISVASGGAEAGFTAGPLYDSFSTGISAINLSGITLLLTGDSSTPGSFSVSIYISSSNFPTGPAFFTSDSVNDSFLSASPAPITFTASLLPVLLAANTQYWIGLNATADSSVAWSFASDNSGTGVSGEFFANSGGSDTTVVFPNDFGPYQMTLTGDPAVVGVPLQPSIISQIFGLCLFGLLGWRNRRRVFAA